MACGIEYGKLKSDLVAGATTALVSVPKLMGYAIMAGVSPIYGLYTAVVPTIVASLTTGSCLLTVAATNALAVTTYSTLKNIPHENVIPSLFVLTLLVGLFQLAFGLLRLGSLCRFASHEVLTGFITGAAVMIVLGQFHYFAGFSSTAGGGEWGRLVDSLLHVNQWNPHTVTIGVFTILAILLLQKTRVKGMAFILALALAAALPYLFGWNVKLVRDVSLIPNLLPAPSIPHLHLAGGLVIPALALAILGLVEGVGIIQGLREPDGRRPSIDRDFLGQGLANIAGSFFQCMVSGGSITATMVNAASGARSRFANLFNGMIVALIVVLLANKAELIPMAAMAGLLMVIGARLVKFSELIRIWKASGVGRGALVVTFVSTQAMPLEYGVYAGVLYSALIYVYLTSKSARVVRITPTADGRYATEPAPAALPGNEVTILVFDGALHYASIYTLQQNLPAPQGARNAAVILGLRTSDQHQISTALIDMLEAYSEALRKVSGRFFLVGISQKIFDQLHLAGAIDAIGPENVFCATPVLGEALETARKAALDWLRSVEEQERKS